MLDSGLDVVDIDDAGRNGVSNGVRMMGAHLSYSAIDVGDVIGLDCGRNLKTFVLGSCSGPRRMLGSPEGDGYVGIKADVCVT